MKVLRIFVESTLKRRETAFSAQSLMTEMYGPRWIHHPKRAETINYYSLVLASLEEARDLSSKKGTYHLQGGGLKTIADYELEERRHRDNRSRQTVLSILTAVLAFIGLGQLVIDVVGRPDTAPPAVAQPSNSAR